MYRPKGLWITNEVAVDGRRAVEVGDNGEGGDGRVALVVAPGVGRYIGETFAYLGTNGGPFLVQEQDGDDAVGLATAARTLGMSQKKVLQLLRARIPDLWWVPQR